MSPNTLLCELSKLQETEIENMSLRRFNMIILWEFMLCDAESDGLIIGWFWNALWGAAHS